MVLQVPYVLAMVVHVVIACAPSIMYQILERNSVPVLTKDAAYQVSGMCIPEVICIYQTQSSKFFRKFCYVFVYPHKHMKGWVQCFSEQPKSMNLYFLWSQPSQLRVQI